MFPPETIEVRGGPDKQHLATIGTLTPVQPTKDGDSRVVAYTVPLKAGTYPVIEIKVKPVPKLPSWHGGKGKKAWFFLDEVFLR
jgi:hypothetical protein